MICPVRSLHSNTTGYRDLPCIEEECAWWEMNSGSCCIKRIAKSLILIEKEKSIGRSIGK